ncbi:DEAD/DEAH box helicase [Nonomuraea sp. NN258]|nr:DEAD/DEAH box helicase [Nonomuraea antri]
MWGVRPGLAAVRYGLPGWRYLHQTELVCPRCSGLLHGLGRTHHVQGQPRVQAAAVCPACPATFTLQQLKVSRRMVLEKPNTENTAGRPDVTATTAFSVLEGGLRAVIRIGNVDTRDVCDGVADTAWPSGPQVRVQPFHPGQVLGSLTTRAPHSFAGRNPRFGPPREVAVPPPRELRLLYWRKTTDPALALPQLPADTDIRVLLPDVPEFDLLREDLTAADVPYRSVAYWVEDEVISTVGAEGETLPLSVATALTRADGTVITWGAQVLEQPAYDARDAFEKIWDSHEEPGLVDPPRLVPAADLVPASWLSYLPFERLNPAQAQAAPVVLNSSDHLVITAPTGAGKTVVGMLAVLRAILGEGRKAAWLVPQRSLTDELDRELERWRGQGLRVERLSGEYSTDIERVRVADLWVATTEKFEAICRASSLQTALSEVGCLVVDEIHLLGSAGRGPLLEALLARVRGVDSPVRIVGLSATVSNAAEIAEWLDGRLITTSWRPARLTWQLPVIPASSDRKADNALRTRTAVELTQWVTGDGGSVLVFCGSKRNVRSTALALAAARGAPCSGIDVDDIDRLHEVCSSAGIGLHYKDWEFKRQAEAGFRNHDLDVLVATSTVAAGVNLPARAVIVRDTQIGLDSLDVAMVLQMFGRAGRIGAGENQGWAYLITSELERANWQGALVDGYTVNSQIHASLPDHVLAEVVQGRITTVEHAEQWWRRTLCHHQGDDDIEPVIEAVDFLIDHGYLAQTARPDGSTQVTVTELGLLTTRLMVNTEVGADLRTILAELPVPNGPDLAEDLLIHVLAVIVPELLLAPVTDSLRPVVATVLKAGGHRDRLHTTTAVSGLGAANAYTPGDLAQAALLLVAHSPELFVRGSRVVAGLPSSTIFPILEQAPRYFAWLAAQGYLNTVHPWVAIVAADLEQRVRWRRCGPRRGAGRLLWMCEEMATPLHVKEFVPTLWASATTAGMTAPDWPNPTPPRHCKLEPGDYTLLLRERTTGCVLTQGIDEVSVDNIAAGILIAWNGRTTTSTVVTGRAAVDIPPRSADEPDDADRGAAIFTRRGDYTALGWLAENYNTM